MRPLFCVAHEPVYHIAPHNFLGDCDTLTLHLIKELGWLEELKARRDLLPDHSQREPLLQ